MIEQGCIVKARPIPNGLGHELFHEYFGTTCRHESFRGLYDLWPFCRPYDAEEWWDFMEEDEAIAAAEQLTKYLQQVPLKISPQRISFEKTQLGYELRNNGQVCGMHLFRSEDEKNPWPFGRIQDWTKYKAKPDALKACIRLQDYLDGRGAKMAKTKKK